MLCFHFKIVYVIKKFKGIKAKKNNKYLFLIILHAANRISGGLKIIVKLKCLSLMLTELYGQKI